MKSDVGGNIDRLERRALTNRERYQADIFRIVDDEVADGSAAGSRSCTKALLWLKRAMEFVLKLLERLMEDQDVSLSTAATETYYETLQQYHGWIVTGTFTVALQLVPSRDCLFESIFSDSEEDRDAVMEDMKAFIDAFRNIVAEVHEFLTSHGLDDPTKV